MPLDYLISQLRVVFKMLKEKKHELMIIYPGKLLFTHEREIKPFSN